MDSSAKATDKRLSQIEERLKKLYGDSQADITKAWNKYMLEQNAYIKDLQEAYQRAKLYGTAEEARELGKQLGVAKAERTLQNEYYKNMVEETTRKLANVNQTALAYINNQMPWVYMTNYNEAANLMGQIGRSFNMVDESTVRRMVMDDDIKLPYKDLNKIKDVRWNTKQLNSAVLQGIVNGESMDKIAERILPIVNNNQLAAIRNARTMTTGAQNLGRLDSYHRMEEDGIVLKKIWMATHDERTRISHAEMDGEMVDPDELFSNELMYPGDPDGDPEEVYNCRCTMVTKVMGFVKEDGSIEYIDIEGYDPSYDFPQLHTEESGGSTESPAELPTYKERIEELQRMVEENGLTSDYIMEAGHALQDELNPIYEGKMKEVEEAKGRYEQYRDEYKEISQEYNAEFDRRFVDESLFGNEEYLQKVQNMEKALGEAEEKMNLARIEYRTAEGAIRGDSAAIMMKDKLSEVREMGYDGIDIASHLHKSRSEVRANVEYAYDKYPKSWVEKSVDRGMLTPKKVDRGYYSDYSGTIAISGWNNREKNETALHELGHRFERAVPGLRDQEKAFYERRTAGLELEWLGPGYSKSEVTRKDDFVHSYMGKDYGGHFYELVSMGFEYAYMDPGKLMKDPDMQQWIFGLLTLVP